MSEEGSLAEWVKGSRAIDPGHLIRHNREELLYIAGEQLRVIATGFRRRAHKRRGLRPVGYIGWLGHRNLGDQVMYHVISRQLSRLELDPFLPPSNERGLSRFGLSGGGFFRAVLLGGGTLLNPLSLEAARLVRSFGLPLYVVGTGVGSPGFGLPETAPLEGWREVLAGGWAAVRGPRSQRLLEQIGVRAKIFGDPALGMTRTKMPAFRSRRRLILNLARERGVPYSSAEAAAVAAVGEVARKFVRSGGEVVGVALGNGDRLALKQFRLENRLSAMRIEDHRTQGDPFLRTVEGSVGLIGVRLHSAVLACCVGVPPLLLSYRDKCADFMDSMELGEFTVPFQSERGAEAVREGWGRILESPELGRSAYCQALAWKERQDVEYKMLIGAIDDLRTARVAHKSSASIEHFEN